MPKKKQNSSQPSLPVLETTPPASDELEISLFGPGVGECIVAHLGQGVWMVVDSCFEATTKEPIALHYLRKIGVDPATAVKIIIISHWHDDHTAGASRMITVCESAKVFYSIALLGKEFITLYQALASPISLVDRYILGVREMASIVEVLNHRARLNPRNKAQILHPVIADRLLFQSQIGTDEVKVWALSPSGGSVQKALMEIGSLIPTEGDDRRVVPRSSQNHNAVVVWIQFGERAILLGSDLLETGDPYTGWTAIVNSQLRPQGKANLFKIPHHGSHTGHCHEVWTEMTEGDNSHAILTTFTRGQSIPTKKDIDRLKGYTQKVYCTLEPKSKTQKRPPAVEKTIKGMVKQRKVLGGEMGQIQVRMKRNSEIRLALKPPAILL